MPKIAGKTYWLIGASEGIGAALAKRLSALDAHVVLTARNLERLKILEAEIPNTTAIAADVTDSASLEEAARKITSLDGIIYMAGDYTPMSALEFDTKRAERMVDINFTGAMRVLGASLPRMIADNRGHIVLIGSLASYRGLPEAVGYAASKAGLVSLAETLAIDLRGTGITVQIAHPGFVKTRLTDKNEFDMPFIQTPEEAAEEIIKLMISSRFSRAFPWLFSLFFRLSVFFPNGLYFRFFSKSKRK